MWGLGGGTKRERRERLQAQWRAEREEKAAFLRQYGDHVTAVGAEYDQTPLLLVVDVLAIHWVELAKGEGFIAKSVTDIPLSAIHHVDLARRTTTSAYKREVRTPVVTTKKKSVIGRGVIGATVLGPAGLILGAASALAPESEIVEHVSRQPATRSVKGPPTLRIVSSLGRHQAEIPLPSAAEELRDALLAHGLNVASDFTP